MENQKNNYLNHAIQYGVILAVIRVLLDVALKTFNVSGMMFSMSSFLAFIIEIILIILAVKIFRDSINNGMLSIPQALKIGIIMMIITGALYFVSANFYMPEYSQTKALEMIEQYQPDKYDDMVAKLDEARENPNYILSFGTVLLWFIFLGALISVIAGAIFKKNDDNLY